MFFPAGPTTGQMTGCGTSLVRYSANGLPSISIRTPASVEVAVTSGGLEFESLALHHWQIGVASNMSIASPQAKENCRSLR